MEHSLKSYLPVVEAIVREWGASESLLENVETEIICDHEQGIYLLLSTGWHGYKRIHSLAFHARVRDNKLWIEWDGTDPSMTEEMFHRGVPRECVVFGWQHPSLRADLALTSP
jgi:hypothetical protein